MHALRYHKKKIKEFKGLIYLETLEKTKMKLWYYDVPTQMHCVSIEKPLLLIRYLLFLQEIKLHQFQIMQFLMFNVQKTLNSRDNTFKNQN